ncbi:unnamed protein product [Cylicocyclus nassatus]|uniref:Uncharacterized protein n=1 Tax=Cylicocyclus nassatus TaxID=53992 RepID=A0AA36GG88_CYLNA|nr:unnamed protein product [Cylicocyclus nassatus]
MKRFLFLLSVTTSAFDPVLKGCKSSWKAYSPDSTLNDRERERIIDLIGEARYFCDYEKLACDIRNNLTAEVKGRIPNVVDASLAKVFLGLKNDIEIIHYDVEIIEK